MNKDKGQVLNLDGGAYDTANGSSDSLQNRQGYPVWLATFVDIYQRLGTDNLQLLLQVYAPNVHFQDPLHVIEGRKQLLEYFDAMYTNLSHCRFTIDDVIYNDQEAAIYWHMNFIHSSLNNGKAIEVQGHTRLRADGDKVSYHRDYLDAGAMLYEHIPVLGRLVKMVKNRAGQ
ncbi:nuclear transport factor 2 family protein [Thalassotalea sp. PS06]|uniref:nuclear transport factor 2 family protein n=1 Tax=Thalassotalea sp. PS06 TaxID=2594005 RepID=UPI0011628229|nr:nuclear transport factor 2 family protein [Thalassotalea sp. PS06]QDP02140.1 nuclear transport factor 2 family protein [Thalassotalea sp. PS06]